MNVLIIVLNFIAVCFGATVLENPVVGYLKKHAVPLAEEIEKAEDSGLQRIVGGVPAAVGQYPWQAGLIIDIIGMKGRGVCGGSLISSMRLVTAAHCWSDGMHKGWRITTVLGSVMLFSGGTRVETSVVVTHPDWFPWLVRNDIAVVYLPHEITYSDLIAPVSLPTGTELFEDFAGEAAIATGFGLTGDGQNVTELQSLYHVRLQVISNSICRFAFPLILQNSNLCTSGVGGHSTCQGDSGGPLVIKRDDRNVLIGVTSFGSGFGCESTLPAAYTRVTSYLHFLQQHLDTSTRSE